MSVTDVRPWYDSPPSAEKYAVIIGASSMIASAISRELAARRWSLLLVGRDEEKLQAMRLELARLGASSVATDSIDVLDSFSVDALFDRLDAAAAYPSLVLLAPGVSVSNENCFSDMRVLRRMIETNFSGVAHCAVRAARLLSKRQGGEVVVISSVAGDRGRPKNFCYGSSKAGLDAFLEGLQLSLDGSPVNIVNIKPGPVQGLIQRPNAMAWLRVPPESVARTVIRVLGKRRHRVYAPYWWQFVMCLVRMLPGRVLVKLRI